MNEYERIKVPHYTGTGGGHDEETKKAKKKIKPRNRRTM